MAHTNRISDMDPDITPGEHIFRAIAEKEILLKCGFEPTECLLIHINGIPYITIKQTQKARRKRGKQ